ncbi:MAG: glycine cleavage system protein GcvH [Desulfitobacterium hafniense]|nr:glycine cleavage system protein GcvH [Desulfitobacterium hafniense]
MNPTNLKYAKSHEWAKLEGDIATIGISDHAQESLGDVVFVELPGKGVKISAGKSFGTVESVKAVSEINAPVSGEIIEFNQTVLDSPDILNSDPYGDGWLIKIKVEVEDLTAINLLMDAEDYERYLAEEEH